jgi:hypothetical protein
MDKQPTSHVWRMRAAAVLERVTRAESRFSASMGASDVTMLAAADELEAATREAIWWMSANTCPDRELGEHVAQMLNTCAEVALTADRALTDPAIETAAVMGRLGYLLAVIDLHSESIEAW